MTGVQRSLTGVFAACVSLALAAQSGDSTFVNRIASFAWMPDGRAMIVNVIRLDPTERTPPVAKKAIYDLETRQLRVLPIQGSGVSMAPDGRTAAYIKFTDGDIYLQDLVTGKEELLLGDTLRKGEISWSSDGGSIAYTVRHKSPAGKTIQEIWVVDLRTRQPRQITHTGAFQCYGPTWNPTMDRIAYFLEKGDGHDQIYLTDSRGSFHTNLSNDATTHNYHPSWFDEQTILFTRDPDAIMTMHMDGSRVEQVKGLRTAQAKYSPRAGKYAYVTEAEQLATFDPREGISRVVLEIAQLGAVFPEVQR